MINNMKCFIVMQILFSLFTISASGGQEDKIQNEINFFWWGGESRHEATLMAVRAYNESHPEALVIAEYQNWDGYYEKLTTQLSAGAGPDIFQFLTAWVSDISNNPGIFYDLRTLKNFDISGWSDKTLYLTTIGDKLIGAPLGENARILIYNKDLADSLNLTINDYFNWQDFDRIIQNAKKQDPQLLGYSGDIDQLKYTLISYLVQSSGKKLITNEVEFGFSVEDLEEGLNLLLQWFDRGTFQSISKTILQNSSWTDPKWLGGEILFSETPITLLEQHMNYDFTIDITRYWQKDGELMTGNPVGPNLMFCLNSRTEYPEIAGSFLNFILTEEEGVTRMGLQRGIPSNSKAYDILLNKNYIDGLTEKAMKILKDSDGGQFSFIESNEIDIALQDAIMVVGFKDKTPEEAAVDFLIRGNKILEDYK